MSQQDHHRRQTFVDEYKGLLIEEGVSFDPRYIFHEPV
jgi:hypothetical protein